MKKATSPLALLLSAMLMASLLFSSCGALAEGIDISEHVDLTMYLIGSPARDYDLMLEELNKVTEAELNASVTVNWIGWADFGTKYPLMLASGEPVDLVYASTWTRFYKEAMKGAFLPLEELAPIYAPITYAEISDEFRKQVTFGEHVYGIPASFYQVAMMGYIVRGDLMKEYGITEIDGIDGYGEFLQKVVDNTPEIVPTGIVGGDDGLDAYFSYEQNYIDIEKPFYIDFGNPVPTVVNLYDNENALAHFKKMKEWCDRGYWSKSILADKEDDKFITGRSASRLHNQDSWMTAHLNHPEFDAQFFFGRKNAFSTVAMQDGMAIPASAPNPERALMLLERLHQDPVYYNFLTYGIEGVHYEINENDELIALDIDGFSPEGYCSWGFKSLKWFKQPIGMPPNLAEIRAALQEIKVENPYAIFFADFEPVKNEQAAILNVLTQYGLPLSLGLVDDVEASYNNIREKLELAGASTMQAELQRQLDAYMAEQNNPS